MSNPAIKIDVESEEQKVASILTYLEWNNKIAKHFFNPDKSGTRVWFSVERDLIEKVAQENNTDFEDFIKAVKKGPDSVNRPNQTICSKAHAIFQEWKNNNINFEYPPYISYLALFVLAVNHGDSEDFSEGNYYGRLGDLVQESLSTNNFKHIPELWDDLEKWSLNINFGEFHLDIVGQRFYVGIPQYQVVLTKEDRKHLPEIFWKMGWDSDSNPTEKEILIALKNNKNFLSKRTSKRIEKGKSDFLSVLVDRVLEELKEYNEEINIEEGKESEKRGSISLCLEIDETAEQIDTSFRCRRKAGLPEEEFTLTGQNTEWKVPFSFTNISDKIKNFNVDWEKDLSAKSEKYSFHYNGQKYKVFTPAKDVSAWISGQRYIPNKLFYLAVHKSLFDKVQEWGEKECNECQVLKFSGLPNNWHLFKIRGVNKDSIKKHIPALSIDQKPRIKLEGGIRVSQGNKFFSFAPPHIFITGWKEEFSTSCYSEKNIKKDKLIRLKEEESIFLLPENLPQSVNLRIEVLDETAENLDSRVKDRKNLMFVENQLKKNFDYPKELILDCFGEFKKKKIADENSTVEKHLQGANGFNVRSSKSYQRFPDISLNPKETVYLIGEIPGQIIVWPDKPLPNLWVPIWLVQFKTHKKAVANWLGNNILHIEKSQNFSKEEIQLWKDVVWHKRKRIKSEVKKKWREFSERAKNV